MGSTSDQKRLDFLDVARGAAAIIVLLEHGFHQCVPGYFEFAQANVVIGQSAILVFFMISGFVVPMSLEAGTSTRSFWARRFFRLFPVYWFSIALAFGYLLVGGPQSVGVEISDTTTWISNLALLQGWLGKPNVWGVFWSLHFELAFYVICSVLFACGLLRHIGTKTFVALLVGFGLACTGKLLRTKNPTDDIYNWMIVLSALFGMIAYRFTTGRMTQRTFHGLMIGLFAVLFQIWCVNHLLFPNVATLNQLARSVIIGGLAFGAFVYLLHNRGRRLSPVAGWFGRRSYPIYLLHPFVVLLLASTDLPAWVFMPCLVVCTLLLAELTHRFIERPGVYLGRWLLKRPKVEREAVASLAVERRALTRRELSCAAGSGSARRNY